MFKKLKTAFTCLFLLAFTSVAAWAQDSVIIRSDNQSLSSQGGQQNMVSVFTGNVYVNYNNGQVTMTAAKVVVNSNGNTKTIVATGSPVVVNSPSQNFNLKAARVDFNLSTNVVVANSATVLYKGNRLSSNVITYNVKTQDLNANGSRGRQVETIIKSLQ